MPEAPQINTPTGEDHCPIIALDSLIYFDYQQPGVPQDSDIWKVEKKDGIWLKPESLGSRINSPYVTICNQLRLQLFGLLRL